MKNGLNDRQTARKNLLQQRFDRGELTVTMLFELARLTGKNSMALEDKYLAKGHKLMPKLPTAC